MRDKYAFKMKGTPDADDFETITDQVNPATLAFREVAARVAQIDTLEPFRDNYVKAARARSGQVAALN